MQIDLRELDQGQTHLTYEISAPSVGLSEKEITVEGPLLLGLSLDRRGDEIWIRGKAQLVARHECSRCLVEFSEKLELEFEVFCAKVRNPNVVSSRAADEEDGGVHFHDGRVLIIDEEIREALMATDLNIIEKSASDMPYFAFKLYSNIVVPNYVKFDRPSSKKGVEFFILRLSKKDSMTGASFPSSLSWNV